MATNDVRRADSMYSAGMRTRKRGKAQGTRHPAPQQASSSNDLHRLDVRLDEALEETFPASDPVAVTPHPPKARGVSGR
jgi:hypothetical protein